MKLLLPFLFAFFTNWSFAQSQENFLNGFRESVAGTNFTYHSPYSHNEKSLLSRANRDFAPIEWTTDYIPKNYSQSTVSFIWLYGMDVLNDQQQFELSVNGEKLCTFSSPVNNEALSWQATSQRRDVQLVFHRSMVDKHGDQMGYAVLTLPTNMVGKGQVATIKVDGVDNGSSAWFMTFKVPLESRFSARQLKTVSKVENELLHTIRFNLVHLASAEKATLSVGEAKKEITLNTGLNELNFSIPKVDQPTEVKIALQIGENIQERTITVAPVKEWTIHLVQHSHTDIGYTRPQSQILAEHLRFIDNALDYCDQTDHYPDHARFRWTCEASWTVKAYLESRPKEQVDRLLKRIKEGRIEVTGMYFNFSEIIDETALAIQAQTLKGFKDRGIDVNTAMQNDVNGIGWCMIDVYHNTGVKYLTMGQHGHRARIPFDKPTSFWWTSPSGKRLLAYRSEHYMHGNTLSLTSGKIDVFRNNLSGYLSDLEEKDYPLDRVALQFSGYITDNSPPSTKACDIVKEWNEKYEWPKLKLSLASEFMVYLDQNHGDHLEVKKVAWPDWWTDGFGSAMNETKTARIVHTEMIATMGLLAMAQKAGGNLSTGIHDEIRQCYESLLFYDEHTFGADESITNPNSKNSINQWRQKSSYVWSANQQANLLREKAIGLIQPYVEKTRSPSVTVFNTLNWERSGVVEVFIDHDALPLDKKFSIEDTEGKAIPAQIVSSRNDGTTWALWVEQVPPMGYKAFTIKVSEEPLEPTPQTTSGLPAFLENDYYKIVIDQDKGGISSWQDKELQKDLVDPNRSYQLGEFMLQKLDNRADMERLTYLNRDTVYKPLAQEMVRWSELKVVGVRKNKIWNSILLTGKLPEGTDDSGVAIEVRLFNHSKKVELLYNMNKLPNPNPEGGFVAFPFKQGETDQLIFEAQGGVVEPGKNQLEGTASDWNTIQNFAAVRTDNSQIVFCSNDAPLVQFGAINTGRYYYKHQPGNGHIYSWVFNNYWTTNFKASQQGELEWKYAITSSKDNSLTLATKFGWGNRVPLISRFNPSAAKSAGAATQTFIDLGTPDNLLLVNARPALDGTSIFLHLRETEGDHAILDVSRLLQDPRIVSVVEVNSLEEEIKTLTSPLLIEHFETKFFLLKLAQD